MINEPGGRKKSNMIKLHRFNGDEFVLNSIHIETVEEKPDTTITLTNERKYIVKEKKEEILRLIIEYQRKVFSGDK